MKFIVCWGVGGCWSGHSHADIVDAGSEEEAYEKCEELALGCKEIAERSDSSGFSMLAIEYTEEFSQLSCLKQSAVDMLIVKKNTTEKRL